MKLERNRIYIEDADIQEIFGLFTSATKYERDQIYDPSSPHYYKRLNILEECSISEEKKEFALDAWRSVLGLLSRNGFTLLKDGKEIALKFTEEEFS